MSRRGGYDRDGYDDREYYRPARNHRDRDRSEVDIDIRESRSRGPERRTETIVLERDREDRRTRVPDFLRDDYGKATDTQQLVIREEIRDDDTRSRLTSRRRSNESLARSRVSDRVVDREEIIIRETDKDRRLPYPSSEIGRGGRDEEIRIRERSRAPSRAAPRGSEEEIDIKIRRRDDDEHNSPPPRSEVRERDVEEIRIRRGDGERRAPRREVVKEEIEIRETRESPPRRREERDEIDIRIRETERERRPRQRSQSRGNVVASEREEWIVRRPRKEPSPPPRDYEKEEIIIRRKERSVSPEPPPRAPSPEPLPVPDPIVRPPIVQEVITHYRNIDHGFERAREPSPPTPPPPARDREDDLEIAIRRTGTRNGRAYDEELIIEQDRKERDEVARRPPSAAPIARRRYEEDDISREADYYNQRATSRTYPGEAYNGATRKWELVDIPPGTERVRMDGIGGGAQEITWQRYNGERTSKFYAGDRIYESDFERRAPAPAPAPLPAPPARNEEKVTEETRIERRTVIEESNRPRVKDRMWTEVTKDLVIKEAIEESGYDCEETDEFYYVMEYLRYEDVLKLVELTEEIRRERRERIREIQWEREELERAPKLLPAPPPIPAPPRSVYDERIYEREYIYDRDGRRYRR